MCNEMLTTEIREQGCCPSTQQKVIVRFPHFLDCLNSDLTGRYLLHWLGTTDKLSSDETIWN